MSGPSLGSIPGQFSSLVRVAVRGPSTSADGVVVLGSANDTDPIDGGNPNQLATRVRLERETEGR